MSIEKPQDYQELSLIEKAIKYNEEVQAIFEELEDSIGDRLRGQFMSDGEVRDIENDEKIAEEIDSAANRLSSIGKLKVTSEELKDLLSKKLGLKEMA